MFFAASGIDGKSFDPESRFGVWVLSKQLVTVVATERRVEIVEVPKFQNTNIIAQEGLFINYSPSYNERKAGMEGVVNYADRALVPLDHHICNVEANGMVDRFIKEVTGKPMLFTLPHSQASQISQNLKHLGISWVSIEPNLTGAVKQALIPK